MNGYAPPMGGGFMSFGPILIIVLLGLMVFLGIKIGKRIGTSLKDNSTKILGTEIGLFIGLVLGIGGIVLLFVFIPNIINAFEKDMGAFIGNTIICILGIGLSITGIICITTKFKK